MAMVCVTNGAKIPIEGTLESVINVIRVSFIA